MTVEQENYARRGLQDWIKRILERHKGKQADADAIIARQLICGLATHVAALTLEQDMAEFEKTLAGIVNALADQVLEVRKIMQDVERRKILQ